MLSRSNFVDFGIVSTSNTCLFGSIQVRDMAFSGHVRSITHPPNGAVLRSEKETITTQETKTVYLQNKCKHRKKRDIYNFDPIDPDPFDLDALIPEDEVEIEGA